MCSREISSQCRPSPCYTTRSKHLPCRTVAEMQTLAQQQQVMGKLFGHDAHSLALRGLVINQLQAARSRLTDFPSVLSPQQAGGMSPAPLAHSPESPLRGSDDSSSEPEMMLQSNRMLSMLLETSATEEEKKTKTLEKEKPQKEEKTTKTADKYKPNRN